METISLKQLIEYPFSIVNNIGVSMLNLLLFSNPLIPSLFNKR